MKRIKEASPTLSAVFLTALTCVFVFVMLAGTITPEQYDLRAGEVSPITITATKDVEDKISTERLAETAARSVQPSYISDNSVQPTVLSGLQEDFSGVLQYRARTGVLGAGETPTEGALKEALGVMPPLDVPESTLISLMRMEAASLSKLYERTYALVRETLLGKLPEGQEEDAIQKIRRDLINMDFSAGEADVAEVIVRHNLRANMLLDEETTELNRQKEREKVEAIIYKKGQNIVRGGEVVTENQIAMLRELGLLKDKNIDISLLVGLGAVVAMLAVCMVLYMREFMEARLRDTRMMALLSMIVLVTVSCMLACSWWPQPYFAPVAMAPMLVTLLISPNLAFVVNIALSIIAGLFATTDSSTFTSVMFTVTMASLVSGTLCVPLLRRRNRIVNIAITGLIVGAGNMAITLAMGFIGSADQMAALTNSLWAGGSGVLSAIMTILLQLVFEWLFNLVTPTKLMDLANPNQPLLRRLMIEAPGTYHHSIIVANLAEAAASAVGANELLARVGAYYHDVGKLKRPLYFKENQLSDNPHDRTDPRVSTAILTAHPRDGVELGQKMRLPQAVIDIIAQHHGDTPVLYFYDKAVKQGSDVELDNFRYDYSRPRSSEAAIVMLADTVEAAVRAVPEPSQEKITQLIRRLVRSKMEDGQLDECALTFADLNKICDAFVTVMSGIYHERIEYPDIALPERSAEVKPSEEKRAAPAEEPKAEDAPSEPATDPHEITEEHHAD